MPPNRSFTHTPGTLTEVSGVSLSNSPYIVCVDGTLADAWANVLKRNRYRRYTMGPDKMASERFHEWHRRSKDKSRDTETTPSTR